MCGIAGFFSQNASLGGNDINRMSAAIKHRGPDDEGYLVYQCATGQADAYHGDDSVIKNGANISACPAHRGGLYLAHRRLSIIDVSPSGHQPMSYDGGRLQLVFNGEIYNYREIREELKRCGHRFATATDTEVVLAAYRQWGFACLDKFNGMWAFALLDVEKNLLFCARDRFGVKPFYYLDRQGVFAFASEPKALAQLDVFRRTANDSAVYDYLMWGRADHFDNTFFSDARKLPHSHFLVYDLKRAKLDIKQYYSLPYNTELGHYAPKQAARYTEEVRELLVRSVDARLMGDVPVGSCLSGGVDSSTIVCIINSLLSGAQAAQLGDRQKVFTAAYAGEAIDESVYAGEVAAKTKSEWHRVSPVADELGADLEKLVYSQDEPFNSTSVYAQYRVARLASENGVKVLLDGQGGDELFTGYAPFHGMFFLELLKNLRLASLFSETLHIANSPIGVFHTGVFAAKHLGGRLLPASLLGAVKGSARGKKYINPEFAARWRSNDAKFRELAPVSVNGMCKRIIDTCHLQTLLRYEDRNSMAHSIEARTPFADDRPLIEKVFSIPSIYKIHNGWSKTLLRDAAQPYLPDKIRLRVSKLGFEIPERKWLLALGPQLRPLFDAPSPYVDTAALRRDFDALLSSGSQADVTDVWRFINIALWQKTFGIN